MELSRLSDRRLHCERRIMALRVERERRQFTRRLAEIKRERETITRNMQMALCGLTLSLLVLIIGVAIVLSSYQTP